MNSKLTRDLAVLYVLDYYLETKVFDRQIDFTDMILQSADAAYTYKAVSAKNPNYEDDYHLVVPIYAGMRAASIILSKIITSISKQGR
jgi:hypothetical protein